ncbi:hypothetical protein PT974_09541 [Cladobotryum mycophilum]|uniref:Uncharacterized protein n=1 Tax=Cladobotryum mycophilum TaxID=491253 RepID=A0ABR0SHF4_9HYPO
MASAEVGRRTTGPGLSPASMFLRALNQSKGSSAAVRAGFSWQITGQRNAKNLTVLPDSGSLNRAKVQKLRKKDARDVRKWEQGSGILGAQCSLHASSRRAFAHRVPHQQPQAVLTTQRSMMTILEGNPATTRPPCQTRGHQMIFIRGPGQGAQC